MILCYDISQLGSSLLIADAAGTQVKAVADNAEAYGFSLPDALTELWQQAECSPDQLSKLIVTLGPGSYTGIRAGLAVLQAYRLALPEATYIGISNLYLMAWRAHQDYLEDNITDGAADIGVIAHTKRKDFFWQSFDSNLSAVSDAMVLDGQSLSAIVKTYPRPLILSGNNVMPFLTDYPLVDNRDIMIHPTEPKAQDLLRAHLASPSLGENQWQPLYLKPPDTTPRKKLQK